MSLAFACTDASDPMRPDLAEAHRAAWEWIAAPGSWWTGPERASIATQARQARSCTRCGERKAAQSPLAVEGAHESVPRLPGAAAVVGNFERMVRIADGSGIPLDTSMSVASATLREDLGIDAFGSAANTPEPSPIARGVGGVARILAFGAMRALGRQG